MFSADILWWSREAAVLPERCQPFGRQDQQCNHAPSNGLWRTKPGYPSFHRRRQSLGETYGRMTM